MTAIAAPSSLRLSASLLLPAAFPPLPRQRSAGIAVLEVMLQYCTNVVQ